MIQNWRFPDPEEDLEGFLNEAERFYIEHLDMPARFIAFGQIALAMRAGELMDKMFQWLSQAQRQVPYFRWV